MLFGRRRIESGVLGLLHCEEGITTIGKVSNVGKVRRDEKKAQETKKTTQMNALFSQLG